MGLLKKKFILILIFLVLIINSNISLIIVTNQSINYKKENDHNLNGISLNSSNPPILNETIRIERGFTAYSQYDPFSKKYKDIRHTAIGEFLLIGYNSTLNITFSNIRFVEYADIIIRNKENGTSINFYFNLVDIAVVNNSQNWEYRFRIYYSYSYRGCISVTSYPFCDESGTRTVTGEEVTEYIDFFPQPSNNNNAIPGYNILLILILGTFLTLVIRSWIKFKIRTN